MLPKRVNLLKKKNPLNLKIKSTFISLYSFVSTFRSLLTLKWFSVWIFYFLSLHSSTQDYEYPNHPQSTQHQKNDRCPPPPQMLPERACEVPGCRSDSECERHKRCCYNGCIYACLESVQPPPGDCRSTFERARIGLHHRRDNVCLWPVCLGVFWTVLDWLVQPKPRWLGGNGWLLDGPEEVLQGEHVLDLHTWKFN